MNGEIVSAYINQSVASIVIRACSHLRGIRTRFNECGTPNDLKVRRYAPTVNSTTTVINTDPAVAPTIGGTVAGQTTTSEAPVHPFAGVTISDPNAGASDTLTITLSNNGATGTLSGSGLSGGTNGVYTLAAASAATLSSELQQLVFTPTAGAPGSNTTTTFTLSDLSSADATPTVNSTTTVINTDPAVAPTIIQGPETVFVSAVQPIAQDDFTLSNPSNSVTYTWTIEGGSAPQPPNYENFAIDQFEVTKDSSSNIVFDDTFSGTVPPNGPSMFGTGTFPPGMTYLTFGTFAQLTNGALMTAANAAPLNRTGSDPEIGEQAIINTIVPTSGRLLTSEVGLNYAQNFTIAGTFALVIPQESLAEGYGIFLTDNLLNNPGTETVEIEVINTPAGAAVELTEQNFQTGTVQVLGVAPINSAVLSTANQITLTFTYTAPTTATLSSPNAEPVVASFQLLDNGTPVGSAQTVGSGTIFSSTENFTRAGFFGQAPAVSDSILQGVYGTLDLAQNGGWTYELNAVSSQYQALDLGQTATDPFTVKVANSGRCNPDCHHRCRWRRRWYSGACR